MVRGPESPLSPRPAILLLPLLLAHTSLAPAEGRRPLDAESVRLLPAGAVEVELAAAAAQDDRRTLFPDVEGTALVAPRIGLRAGLGPWGEVRMEADALLRFDPDRGEAAEGAGDWRFAAKLRLGPAAGRVRGAAMLVAKLPVASDDEGLGTDETDLELRGLLGLEAERGRLDLDLGLAILGSPFRERAQEDLAVYAVAWWSALRPRLELGAEVAGRQGGDFFPARSVARVGVRVERGAWRFDAALGAGLSDAAPDLELRGGATYRFRRGGGG